MSQAGNFISTVLPPGTTVQTISGNTGGPVGPDGSNNINVVGDGVTITIAGNPGTHTLTASLIGGGGGATIFPTDSGSAIESGGVLNIIAGTSSLNCGSSVAFFGASDIVELHVTDVNNNTMIGALAGSATIGNTNIGLGFGAGSAYTAGESSNIAIGNLGVATENHVIRLGTSGSGTGQQNKTFIAGIVGVTPVTADGVPVFIGSAGQLGTVGTGGSTLVSSLTGNSGGAVGPSSGNINVVGDGTTINIVGNPGTHTLTASTSGTVATSFTGNTGGAEVPSAGNFNIKGDGTTITIAGTANTLTASLVGTGAIQTLTGSTGGGAISPSAGNINLTAGTGITVTGNAGTHSLTIATTALTSAITSITGDTGGAQTGPAITFAGGTTGLSFGGATNTITTTFAGITANGGTVSLATDATTSTINIGTGAGAKTTTLGSTNTTSTSTLQSGSGGISINSATGNGAISILSGTGTVGISTDATNNTINIGTGAAVKTVTLGSTNSSSTTAIQYGTGNFTLASATGTIIAGASAGQVTMPYQPAFFVYLTNTISNATGDGTFYSVVFDTTKYDVGSNVNLAGPPTLFTAPVTGKYNFIIALGYTGLTSSDTDGRLILVTTSQSFQLYRSNYGAIQTSGIIIQGANLYTSMTAGDTAYVQTYVGVSTKTVNIFGDVNGLSFFSGVLVV